METKPTADPVGFIGLGQIGTAQAARLLDCGYPLVVWNRTPERVQGLRAYRPAAADRVVAAGSPREVATRVSRLVLCLLDDAAVEAVMEGENGLIAGLQPAALVLNCTTVHPATSRRWTERLAARGAHYVDANFSGGADAAERGELTLLIGGDAAAVTAAEDLLVALGTRRFVLGPAGAGSLAKVLNNALAATCLAASGEAIAAARAAGLDPARFVAALRVSSGQNFMLEHTYRLLLDPPRGPVAETHTLRRFREYTRLALDAAAAGGWPQRVVAAADSVYARAIAAGLGDEQFTAFMRDLDRP